MAVESPYLKVIELSVLASNGQLHLLAQSAGSTTGHATVPDAATSNQLFSSLSAGTLVNSDKQAGYGALAVSWVVQVGQRDWECVLWAGVRH